MASTSALQRPSFHRRLNRVEQLLSKFVNTSTQPNDTDGHPAVNDKMDDSVDGIDEIITKQVSLVFDRDSLPLHKEIDFNVYMKMFVHELRTPLSSISMGLELIQSHEIHPKTHQVLCDLRQSIRFMENIFDKFIVIQHGNIELNPFQPFSWGEKCVNVKKALEYFLKDANIHFSYTIDTDVPSYVFGDKYNIKHCIVNLLKNAIKYRNTERASVIHIHVSVDASAVADTSGAGVPNRPASHVSSRKRGSLRTKSHKMVVKVPIRFAIKDNNEPILPHIKEHLFESFNSTSGSGLGLFICRNIVELHGGTIEHHFREPTGNEFVIRLNMEMSNEPSPSVKQSPGGSEKTGNNSVQEISSGKSPNLLIVDDSILNRKMLYKIIQGTDTFHHIFTAVDGRDTLSKCQGRMLQHLHVIIIDKNMPYINGIDVTTELRRQQFRGLIFGVTGDNDEFSRKCFLNQGADYVFTKPMDALKIFLIVDLVQREQLEHRTDQTLVLVHDRLEWRPPPPAL